MFAYCYNSPVCLADYTGEDAIYVVALSFEEEGLPVVGHAVLYLQDENGKWYKTEFTGPITNPSAAKVYLDAMDFETIFWNLYESNTEFMYIKGDFSASYELAKEYNGTNYGGYKVMKNNCLHYVKELLQAGSPDSYRTRININNPTIVPIEYLNALKNTNTLASIYKTYKKVSKIAQHCIGVTIDIFNWIVS